MVVMQVLSPKYESLRDGLGRDHKQAMKECERKLKKSPKDLPLLLLKAHLLLKQRLYDQAEVQCLEFSKIGQPISDLEFIDEIYQVYASALTAQGKSLLQPDRALYALWESIAKAVPPKRREEILNHAFRTSVALGFWETAQQVLMALRREDTKNEHYFFLHAFVTQLLSHVWPEADPKRRKLCQDMAFRIIWSAAENTMKDRETTQFSIHSTQQLRFLSQVLRDQNRFDELNTVLRDSRISELARDTAFSSMRMEALYKLEEWEALIDCSWHLISRSVYGDWEMWRYQALAHAEMDSLRSDNSFSKRFAEHSKLLDLSSHDARPIWLAILTYDTRMRQIDLLTHCLEYLRLHYHQPYCFDDLRGFVERLDAHGMQQIRSLCHELARKTVSPNHLKSDQQLWAEANVLRFDYLSISIIEKTPRELVEAFILNAIRFCNLLNGLQRETAVADAAYLLVAEALEDLCSMYGAVTEDIRMNGRPNDVEPQSDAPGSSFHQDLGQIPLLQAFYLLYTNVLTDPTNYRSRIHLIKVSRELGLFSIAMENYQALKIREIQQETLSHLLYTHVSTIHPFEVTGPSRRNLDDTIASPSKGLEKILTWYEAATSRINHYLAADINDYRYDKAVEFHTLKTGLQRSLWRQMALLERRRISRLSDRTYDETDSMDMLAASWIHEAVDQRDLKEGQTVPSIQETVEAREYFPNIIESTVMDCAQSFLVAKEPVAEKRIATMIKDSSLQGTWQMILRSCIITATGFDIDSEISTKKAADIVEETLKTVESLVKKPPVFRESWANALPRDTHLASLISTMEFLKFSHKLLDLMITQTKNKSHVFHQKVPISRIDGIKKTIKERAIKTRTFTEMWKHNLVKCEQEIFWDRVFEGAIGKEMEKLIGENALADHRSIFRNSALDSLEGVLKIKVP